MCSVSFLPQAEGFDLLMNRDELLSRAPALPPSLHRCGEMNALYPHETSGGTWIGLNEAGLTFALINWYARPQLPDRLSRGTIIPELLRARTLCEAGCRLRGMPLSLLNPFRLIIICPDGRHLQEWKADGTLLQTTDHPWEKRHWFSSGFDEETAQAVRGLTCQKAANETGADTLPWLQRLHRSHVPARDAFSLCMHRTDAGTVSLTRISVTRSKAVITYHPGPPCGPGFEHTASLPRSL